MKTIMRCHLTQVRMTNIKKSINSKCWRRCGEKEPSYTLGGNVTWCNHCGKHCGGSSETEYNYIIQQFHSWVYIQRTPEKVTCTSIFMGVLFTIAKYLSTLSIHQQINGQRCGIHPYTHTHVHTMECYLSIKKNDIFPFAATYMDLEGTEEPGVLQAMGLPSQT